MMIGWDILNKDNSFFIFFKLFRPLRSFCLSNRLSAFCFLNPRFSIFLARLVFPFLSPSAFLFAHSYPPSFFLFSASLSNSAYPCSLPVPSSFLFLLLCPVSTLLAPFLSHPFRPVLSPLSLFPDRFAPISSPGRRRTPRAADDW